MADEIMEIDGSPHAGSPDPGTQEERPSPPALATKDNFREIQVKVHVRQADKDSWLYLGRGVVTQEVHGQSSRVVVRHLGNDKPITTFSEASDLQAEKRGNFVVVGCIEGHKVVSWSLNALNNSETIRLLASIELACYKCKQVLQDPRTHKYRRRIERLIKDDRRKRHRRRKDQEALIDAFAKQNLADITMEATGSSAGANPSAVASRSS